MLKNIPGIAVLFLAMLGPALLAAPSTNSPRVSSLYTTWDDYYVYAAFRVHDTNVLSTNSTITSQPQEDDNVEVFFETNNDRATVRTPQTFQMAVSAGQGAYFSVGNGTNIPVGKPVYTYKFAATVTGTLNNPVDQDNGYDVELAIPWQELGQTGPPKAGTVWGFNAISRDRDSLDTPSQRLYSLSPDVLNRGDVQNPSKWSRIVFSADKAPVTSTRQQVVCARVLGEFPRINGVIVSGDWPSATGLSFGDVAIQAAAPTVAEEPNTHESPFDVQPTAPPPPTQIAKNLPSTIDLPNGGVIRVVPGGIKNSPDMTPPVPMPTPTPGKKGHNNPISYPTTPALPTGILLTSSPVLNPAKPSALVMAIYRLDYNGDGRKAPSQNVWNSAGGSLLADQPMNGAGPWFSALRPLWHRQQMADLRRAGIEVALLRVRDDDPLLPRELDSLVEALKEMKALGQDYPLIGVDVSAVQPNLDFLYNHIPPEFRAMVTLPDRSVPGVIVYDLSMGSDTRTSLADGTPIARIYYGTGVDVVSPGRVEKDGVKARGGGQAYDTAWEKSLADKPGFVVIDSWNDFMHGTEIAASRQYGEQYADETRVQTIQFNGFRQWHAKYLSEDVPRTLYPQTLYQIPVRVENAGTLPWRAGESYSFAPRWYKDGKLFDDSAPRIPIGADVLPGQSVTLSVGLVARDSFGEDLPPGDYTLVFDIVQGQDRWFSYAGDAPLQVPVTVASLDSAGGMLTAQFLGTLTPVFVQRGASYTTQVQVRNDSASAWAAGEKVGYKIQTITNNGDLQTVAQGAGTLSPDLIAAGQIVTTSLPLLVKNAVGVALPVGEYRLHWFIQPASGSAPVLGSYDEMISVVESDSSPSFILSDIPRSVEAGKDAVAQIAIQNVGMSPWDIAKTRIGYHWYYLDGVEASWDGGSLSQLTKVVGPQEIDGNVTAAFRAPDRPGRYALAWDLRLADGTWASTLPTSKGNDLLQAIITVNGKSESMPLDLKKYVNVVGIAGSSVAGEGFDGAGNILPAEMLPPDGTAEIEGNPFLSAKLGPPLYPNGYYSSQSGLDANSNHAVSFLFPGTVEVLPNIVSCQGQVLELPGGNYKAIHVLAAATGGQSVSAVFGLHDKEGTVMQTVSIADWTMPPTAGTSVGLRSPFRYGKNGPEPVVAILGDYILSLGANKKINGLILPNLPAVKIMAITLEK